MIVKTTMTIPAPAATAAIGYIQTGTPPPSTPGEEAVGAGEKTVGAGEETAAAAAECE